MFYDLVDRYIEFGGRTFNGPIVLRGFFLGTKLNGKKVLKATYYIPPGCTIGTELAYSYNYEVIKSKTRATVEWRHHRLIPAEFDAVLRSTTIDGLYKRYPNLPARALRSLVLGLIRGSSACDIP